MKEELSKIPSNTSLIYVFAGLLLLVVIYIVAIQLLRRLGKNPKYLLPKDTVRQISWPLILILFSFLLRMTSLREVMRLEDYSFFFRKASTLLFIFAFTWLLIRVIKLIKHLVIQNYDVSSSDNLKARKVYTQFTILERIFIFIITIMALGIALMSFEEIKEVGISIFASAGVAGIIIGFSAQPIKIDDVVVVEGEWGRIEQITLTYVVVAIWDKRRPILPTTYFIEKPFQNWTKTTADILGTVFLYTDYLLPIEPLRKELERILAETDLWDGKAQNIQVTNATGTHVEIRALMSAKDSPTAWDLRVHVREKLIAFLQENYPESLPRTRVLLNKNEEPETS